MGRRKSVNLENTEQVQRKGSQYVKRDGKGSSRSSNAANGSRHSRNSTDSDGGGGGGRPDRGTTSGSNKNMSRSGSKSGSSFYRPTRPQENAQPAYMGFHFPTGDAQQLDPLPTPRGAASSTNYPPSAMNGSTNTYANGCPPPNGYGGMPSGNMHHGNSTYNMSSTGNGSSPMRAGPPKQTASAPLTRRGSQMRMSPDQSSNTVPSHPVSLPRPGNAPYTNGGSSPPPGGMKGPQPPPPQQPLPSPQHQPQHSNRVSIDFQQMLQSFNNLPELPYVMSPQGPIQPPPFPFPYPDLAVVHQYQQQLQQQRQYQQQQYQQPLPPQHPPQQQQQFQQAPSPQHQFQQAPSPQHPYPPPQQPQQFMQQHPPQQQQYNPQQQYPQPQQQQQYHSQQQQYQQPPQPNMQGQPQAMSPQRSFYGPPGATNGNMNMSAANNSQLAPLPAPVSPSNMSGTATSPAAAAASATSPSSVAAAGAALPRTTSILNRVSSFKKVKPNTAATSPAKAAESPPAASPSSGGILNRVSSFKKAAPAPASPSPPAQTSPNASTPTPPQHSAAAVTKPVAEPPAAGGIMRRKSFFATAAMSAPEPELSEAQREKLLQEKLVLREQERQRLEAERQAREEAEEKIRQQRLEEMRRAAAAEAEEAAAAAAATTTSTLPAPVVTSDGEALPSTGSSPPSVTSFVSQTNVSRASSYSFNSMATTRSNRSNPYPQPQPLPPAPQSQSPPHAQLPQKALPPPQQPQQPQQPQKQPALPPPQPQRQPPPRTASPTPEIGDMYYKTQSSGSSSASKNTNMISTGNRSNTNYSASSRNSQASQPVATTATTATTRGAATSSSSSPAAPLQQPQLLWHRCPTLVLYEIPLRCRRTTNEKGDDVIDDANFPVRMHTHSLRVTDAETQVTSEYKHDELVTHRKNSTNVESKLLNKVRDIVIAGYAASVLSVDSKGLSKPTSAFDSASWMAKQRLVMNVVGIVEKMQTIYGKHVCGAGDNSSSIEAQVSMALVKSVSAAKAAEWGITTPEAVARTFEVVDLLQPEPVVVPFRMQTSVLCGSRLSGVEYASMRTEAEFTTALASAQNNAGVVLGQLADAAALDPENAALAKERDSVFEVLTCVVRHRKEGAVALADQLKESPQAVFARGKAEEVISSDEDDDDARVFDAFNAHNEPSSCSDVVVSCLTCIGVRQSAELWAAALERKEDVAPSALFNTAFGGPAYSVILASVDPTKQESAEALATQANMTIKLHRRPGNGSARRIIQGAKFQAGAAQKELDRPERPSGAEQRDLKTSIRKSAATLDSLEKALAAGA